MFKTKQKTTSKETKPTKIQTNYTKKPTKLILSLNYFPWKLQKLKQTSKKRQFSFQNIPQNHISGISMTALCKSQQAFVRVVLSRAQRKKCKQCHPQRDGYLKRQSRVSGFKYGKVLKNQVKKRKSQFTPCRVNFLTHRFYRSLSCQQP